MRIQTRRRSVRSFGWCSGLLVGLLVLGVAPAARAQSGALTELLSGVVRMKTFINPDGRTTQNLGREREGSAVVIDTNGLILTIGYLMVEAHSAEIITNDGHTVPANVVGYDNQTGFGLLRAIAPLKVQPLAFGKSAELKERDAVVVAPFGGPDNAAPAVVVAKREFAGNWEYLLDQAIFTAPPHPTWSGAALLNHEGKLVGIGSLIVGDATGKGERQPGNMFVPTDLLAKLPLDAREGFVLSLIDGKCSLEEVIDMCAFERIETIDIVAGFIQTGIVLLRAQPPSSKPPSGRGA